MFLPSNQIYLNQLHCVASCCVAGLRDHICQICVPEEEEKEKMKSNKECGEIKSREETGQEVTIKGEKGGETEDKPEETQEAMQIGN